MSQPCFSRVLEFVELILWNSPVLLLRTLLAYSSRCHWFIILSSFLYELYRLSYLGINLVTFFTLLSNLQLVGVLRVTSESAA